MGELRAERIDKSIFVRLLVIMLVMAMSLLTLVAGFFLFFVSPSVSRSVDRSFEAAARVIAASSPDLETAGRLARQLDLQIRYEGPDGAWATDERLPSIAEVRSGGRGFRSHVGWGLNRYLAPAPSGGTYLFSWEVGRGLKGAHDKLLGLLLVLMTIVLVTAHLVLRRLLRPLHTLRDGVARLSSGDLEFVLPNPTRDELGALTDAFNQMVQRVREMVRARDQLLLDVSHELRSPLTRMKVALELVPDDEKKAQIAADVAEMEAMVTELLELERLREGRGLRIERHDLVGILREVAAVFEGAPPGVRVASSLEEAVLPIDADKIRTVVRNLLENAVKYSLPDSRPVEVTVARDGERVVVRVSDDGPGVPEADLAGLFEPFFRVDRSRSKKTGGYGLGLSICKRIVEAHGGTIAVENNPGRGTTFTASLGPIG